MRERSSEINKLEELTDKLSNVIDELQVNDPAILEIEEELDNTLADICETERSKMKTFRMINDERPTKHMINLERKIGGYCSVSRIKTPNPNYVGPEHGGIDDPIINPKNILLTNPKDVRLRMRNYMQNNQ